MSRDDNICWFHGKVSREDAEQILKDGPSEEDGVFLVRESTSTTGDYVLSVLHNREVVHYQIRRHCEDAFFSIDEQVTVHGLESLIQYYQEGAHGLVTKLTTICKGEAPPHDSRTHGRTNLLHRATKEGNYTVVSELLKCGYRSLEAKNEDGQTAVHLAARLGKDEILRKLIESGANVNCRDTAGLTPLHYACQKNNLSSTVRLLIEFGGVSPQTRDSNTNQVPLHEAAILGHPDIISALLLCKAPLRPRTRDNETPLDLARKHGHKICCEMLEAYQQPTPKTNRSQWYHGTLDRHEAVSMLKQHAAKLIEKHDGIFMVRYSDRNGGNYVLTMLHEQQAYNFKIHSQDSWLYIDDGPYHNSLEHLVEHYSLMTDGLPTVLQVPVPPKPKPPLPEFSTIPRQKNRLSPNKSTTNNNVSPNQDRKASLPLSAINTACLSEDMLPNLSMSSNALSWTSNQDFFYNVPANNSAVESSELLDNALFRKSNNLNDMNKNEVRTSPASNMKPKITSSTALLDSNTMDGSKIPKNPNIPKEALILGNVLGEGEFGEVYKGIYIVPVIGEQIEVAIKTLREEHVDANRDDFLREAKLMMSLDHHCIVRLIGISQGPPLFMVQELVALGSMLAYLLEFPERVNPKYELKIWASQIACGMHYLETQKFVHRDLAARNILLSSRHQAKISDFGLSRALSADNNYYQATQGGKWPIKWYAPESYSFGTFSHASDVWSFGVTLWEMFSMGAQPYGERRGAEVIQLIEEGVRLLCPEHCPENMYNLMKKCWSYEPKDRPSFEYLMNVLCSDPDYINIKELVREIAFLIPDRHKILFDQSHD